MNGRPFLRNSMNVRPSKKRMLDLKGLKILQRIEWMKDHWKCLLGMKGFSKGHFMDGRFFKGSYGWKTFQIVFEKWQAFQKGILWTEGPSKDRIWHGPSMDWIVFQRPFMDGRTCQSPTFGKRPAMDGRVFQRPFMNGGPFQCPIFGKGSVKKLSITGRQLGYRNLPKNVRLMTNLLRVVLWMEIIPKNLLWTPVPS